MNSKIKERFIAYAAREARGDLVEPGDEGDEMAGVLVLYVDQFLGVGNPKNWTLTPDEIAAVEQAVVEDENAATVVTEFLQTTLFVENDLTAFMLTAWAEGVHNWYAEIVQRNRTLGPMPAMRQALRLLVAEARGDALTEAQKSGLETLLMNYTRQGEPLDRLTRRAATVLAERNPKIAERLAKAAASV